MLRSLLAFATAATAAVAAPGAHASELIARNATQVRLQADAQGRALGPRSGSGGPVEATPRVGRRQRATAEPGAAAGRVQALLRRLDRAQRVRRVQGTAARVGGRRVHRLRRDALGAPAWQRMPDYGVPATGDRAAWNCASRTGRAPRQSSSSGRTGPPRFHHLYGRLTYAGGGVYGFKSTRFGVPLDTYGRNVFVDTFNSTYGAGWKRENSFLTHQRERAGSATASTRTDARPVGAGEKIPRDR